MVFIISLIFTEIVNSHRGGFRILSFIRKLDFPQRSRFRGCRNTLKWSPPPETLRGWRGGPRYPPEIASEFTDLIIGKHSIIFLYDCITYLSALVILSVEPFTQRTHLWALSWRTWSQRMVRWVTGYTYIITYL